MDPTTLLLLLHELRRLAVGQGRTARGQYEREIPVPLAVGTRLVLHLTVGSKSRKIAQRGALDELPLGCGPLPGDNSVVRLR